MADDLVTRLRDRAYSFKAPDPLSEEAADEIERLQRIREHRGAVEKTIAFMESNGWNSDNLRCLLERMK